MKRSKLTPAMAKSLDEIFNDTYQAYHKMEELRPGGGFKMLISDIEQETPEFHLTQEQVNAMSLEEINKWYYDKGTLPDPLVARLIYIAFEQAENIRMFKKIAGEIENLKEKYGPK
jgi:membrane protein insertase Oxa1/YidC/SpoIIIJ